MKKSHADVAFFGHNIYIQVGFGYHTLSMQCEIARLIVGGTACLQNGKKRAPMMVSSPLKSIYHKFNKV
ncbi:hypothetical protein LPIBR_10201 [Lacticaseibacillus paracasei]|nr:hypothetical protein LPIBR_10201 [Lacticaseibacillus paracasei]